MLTHERTGLGCEHARYVRSEASWTASWRTVSGEPERKSRKSVPIEPNNLTRRRPVRQASRERGADERSSPGNTQCGRAVQHTERWIMEDHTEAANYKRRRYRYRARAGHGGTSKLWYFLAFTPSLTGLRAGLMLPSLTLMTYVHFNFRLCS